MKIKYDNSGEIPQGGISVYNKIEGEETKYNCYEDFIPYRLRSNSLYKRVNTLLCLADGNFDDASLLTYLTESNNISRVGFHSKYFDLNWYSQLSWEEAYRYGWKDSYGAGADGNFKSKDTPARIKNSDIWRNFSELNKESFNKRGFDVWNHLFEPYVGTNLIQRKMLESLRLNGTVVDWYDDLTPVNTYSFIFDEFPGWDKTKALILASRALKNAESYLSSVKDKNCPHGLRLSHGFLDSDFVSDIYGEKFYGAYICFQRYENQLLSYVNDFFTGYLRTKFHNEQLNFWNEIFLSENLFMDERNANRIFRTRTKLLPGSYVQMLPGYLKGSRNNWSNAVEWEDQYTWESINITKTVWLDMKHTPMDWNFIDPNSGENMVWNTSNSWMGDIDESTWSYNRPCSGEQCIVNRNFIPGFEPGNGNSLYHVHITSENTSTFDPNADVLISRGGIVKFWDPNFVLGYMSLDGAKEKFIYNEWTREAV